jgi:hypothetical protein
MGVFRRLAACCAATLAVLLIAVPQFASAQATRTWVSGVGDDANPCSRTAPCKTFAGAISKTAINGEINCIDPGGFGTVTITKSIIIDCTGVLAGVLNSGTNGVVINASGAQVTLRHLDIQGAGSGLAGVRILAAAAVHIDRVTIRGETNSGIEVATSANTQVAVSNSLIRDNTQHGILLAPTGGAASVSVSFTTLTANGSTGIRVSDNGFAAVSDSVLSGNGTNGVTAFSAGGAPARITLDRVMCTSNTMGGVMAYGSGAAIWLSNVFLSNNNYGFNPPGAGGAYYSFGNNRSVGNITDNGLPTSTIGQI